MEKLLKEINEKIKGSKQYKDYLFYKNKLSCNESLMIKKEELDALKKKICKTRNEEDVDLYYMLEKEYKNNLVVKEYLRAKEELYCLLKDIVDILSLN